MERYTFSIFSFTLKTEEEVGVGYSLLVHETGLLQNQVKDQSVKNAYISNKLLCSRRTSRTNLAHA